MQCKLKGAGHCTSAGRMTSVLWHILQRIILKNNRLIDITTNTSMVLNCALITYLMMTAEVGFPDAVVIPRTVGSTYQADYRYFLLGGLDQF